MSFILIDTGYSKHSGEIEKALEKTGCTRKTLKLILFTYGDFDHSGSATYFRGKYSVKIAIHGAD